MSSDSIYYILREMFPQVDARVLKAVALENSKDAQQAVDVVLNDILPVLLEGSMLNYSTTLIDSCYSNSVEAAGAATAAVQTDEPLPCTDGEIVGLGDNENNNQTFTGDIVDVATTLVHRNDSNNDTDQERVSIASEEVILSQSCHGSNSKDEDEELLNNSSLDMHDQESLSDSSFDGMHDQEVLNNSSLDGMHDRLELHGSSIDNEQLSLVGGESVMLNPVLHAAPPSSLINSMQLVTVPVTPDTYVEEPEQCGSFIAVSKNDLSSLEKADCQNTMNTMANPDTPLTDVEKQEKSNFTLATSVDFENLEDHTTMNIIVRSQSDQICSIELLQDIIETAKSEKILLLSTKDSVISLMKEVELKENSVEQVKEEAACGDLGLLTKVKELKQMLQRAKETNDMNAGEVYGEKSILATEVRELQSRLLSLSDERIKALEMLDEMRQVLEMRLHEAEKEIKAAEQEKLDKEESAHKSLAYEESVMEKVVQESKILEQEAVKNAELREFLMDRGRLVDIIQGEVSVLCQDIKVMKEKLDQRVPISKLLSRSQTTSSLNSSCSSMRSMAAEQVPELVASPNNRKICRTPTTDDQLSHGEEVSRHQKELMDDGWEFFDEQECSM